MPLSQPSDPIYNQGTMVQNTKLFTGSTTTTGAGKAIFNLTEDGLTTGTAIFTVVLTDSLVINGWSTTNILIFSNPVVSADKKTLTVDVKQNTSLLSLGLIPFAAASSGAAVSVIVSGY